MSIRQLEVQGEYYYPISDFLSVLGYEGPACIKAKKILLRDIAAGDITTVRHGLGWIQVVSEQGLADILEDHPVLKKYME